MLETLFFLFFLCKSLVTTNQGKSLVPRWTTTDPFYDLDGKHICFCKSLCKVLWPNMGHDIWAKKGHMWAHSPKGRWAIKNIILFFPVTPLIRLVFYATRSIKEETFFLALAVCTLLQLLYPEINVENGHSSRIKTVRVFSFVRGIGVVGLDLLIFSRSNDSYTGIHEKKNILMFLLYASTCESSKNGLVVH